ncbi:MAG: 4-hydroxy-tetrahydrodipicolinate synthase [Gammaproteobacteria bacterium]|nr:MAG: 4-hydroxy-tetrahydrodipicolinate synthase [Gammaproteobacteria bacterium]
MDKIRSASLITAIKTPYTIKGEIDLDRYDYLVEQQIAAGIDGIIVGGTTGEGHLLNWEEHLMLIAHSSNLYGEQLLIVGNSGSNNTREAIKATEYGFASGMHAALQINPYYGKTSEAGVLAHLSKNLDIGPAFIYNVPGRTGQDIQANIIQNLAEHENFIGVKECAGNERIEQYERLGIACWSGNDDECFIGRHKYQSHGVISVTSNIIPSIMRQLMDDNNAELEQSVQQLISWLFCEPNPIAINTALMMTQAIEPVFRLPYLPLNIQQRKVGLALLKAIDVQNLVGESPVLLEDDDFQVVV